MEILTIGMDLKDKVVIVAGAGNPPEEDYGMVRLLPRAAGVRMCIAACNAIAVCHRACTGRYHEPALLPNGGQ